METLIKTNPFTFSARAARTKTASSVAFWKAAEFYRFGITPIMLVIIACVGGGAVAYGAMSDTFQLAAIAFSTSIALALILAIAPMRLIAATCVAAIIIDFLVLIF